MSNISIQSPIIVSPLFLRIKIRVVGGLSKSYINKVLLRTPQLGFICIELVNKPTGGHVLVHYIFSSCLRGICT